MENRRGRSRNEPSSSSSDSSGEPGSPASPEAPAGGNAFANDGSFMELFKKKMEEEERRRKQLEEEEEERKSDLNSADAGQSSQGKKTLNVTSFVRDLAVALKQVGKRRGGAKLALKTGMVAKKQKLDSEAEGGKGDAWSKYMAEVKKYKAHQCGDDDKTRPLVK